MIRHYGIFPVGFNRDDLWPEQKAFLMYLIAEMPTIEVWTHNMKYRSEVDAIKAMTIDDIVLSAADADLAKMQGDNIAEVKALRLKAEKQKRLKEINEKYGVEDQPEEEEAEKPKMVQDSPGAIWEKLMGKGIIDKNG